MEYDIYTKSHGSTNISLEIVEVIWQKQQNAYAESGVNVSVTGIGWTSAAESVRAMTYTSSRQPPDKTTCDNSLPRARQPTQGPSQGVDRHNVQASDAKYYRGLVAAGAVAGHVLGLHHQEQQRRIAD